MGFSVNLSGWRWLHCRNRLHFWLVDVSDVSDFRFHFSALNRFNIDFNLRLNFRFYFNFHDRLRLDGCFGGFSRFNGSGLFDSRFSYGSVLCNLLRDDRIVRSDDLRLFCHWRSNHFRM